MRLPTLNRSQRLVLSGAGIIAIAIITFFLQPQKMQVTSPQGNVIAQTKTPSSLMKLITLSNNAHIEYGIIRQGKYYAIGQDNAGEWWNGDTELTKIEWSPTGRLFYASFERNDTVEPEFVNMTTTREFELLDKPPYARQVQRKLG